MTYFYIAFIFFFGIAIGSFLNVCIHRLPKGESVVHPPSHCPKCDKPIAWYDNIPLASFVLLGGKCRHCSARISARYFLMELVTGLTWVLLFSLYGLTPMFFAGIVFFSILTAVSITDLETGFIPDKLSLPGMFFGLALSTLWPLLHDETIWYWGLAKSALGLVVGGGMLLLMGVVGNLLFKKDSMGGGDIKLLAMMGTFLSVQEVVLVFFFSPFFALPFALYMKFTKKAETIPFGPFLALSGAMFYIFGKQITPIFFF